MSKIANRVNVLLAEEHAVRLRQLAERTHLSPGTVARSLLSKAIDEAQPSATDITALLDSIDGAFDRAEAGMADYRAGRYIPIDEL